MSAAPVRLGLIGLGRWGRVLLKNLASFPGAALTLVASRNPDAERLMAEAFGRDKTCRPSADWREVAGSPELDGVLIATPPSFHAEMARAALEAGLAVFVEKPLTMDPREAEELLETAARRQRCVLVDHVHLFNPAYRELKRLASGLGPLRHIVSEGGNQGPFRPDTPPLWDYGPHDVALALDLIDGSPRTVSVRKTDARQTPEGVGQNVSFTLRFEALEAQITVGNMLGANRRRFEARFDADALVFDDLAPSKLTRRSGPVAVDGAAPLNAALKAFLAEVRGGGKSLDSLRLGVEVVRVLSKVESALGSA